MAVQCAMKSQLPDAKWGYVCFDEVNRPTLCGQVAQMHWYKVCASTYQDFLLFSFFQHSRDARATAGTSLGQWRVLKRKNLKAILLQSLIPEILIPNKSLDTAAGRQVAFFYFLFFYQNMHSCCLDAYTGVHRGFTVAGSSSATPFVEPVS